MSKKVLNIDEFLRESDGVDIILGGKTYTVKDIPTDVQGILNSDEPDMRRAVAVMLGEDEKALENYGIVVLSKIIKMVHENLLEDAVSQK